MSESLWLQDFGGRGGGEGGMVPTYVCICVGFDKSRLLIFGNFIGEKVTILAGWVVYLLLCGELLDMCLDTGI